MVERTQNQARVESSRGLKEMNREEALHGARKMRRKRVEARERHRSNNGSNYAEKDNPKEMKNENALCKGV
jgi:hypothetical protein